jgi:hypothetical protein
MIDLFEKNKELYSQIPTSHLVKELISRDETTWMSVPEKINHKCLCLSIDDTLKETIHDCIVGSGPCVIIAVREFKL